MNWKIKALIIWALAIPAFTGYPVNHIPGALFPGASYGWLAYGAMVYSTIVLLIGKKVLKVSIVVALTIAVPLVLFGTLISTIGQFMSGWSQSHPADYIVHYISLMVTMLVVIPLALSMVAVIPFHRLEQQLLLSKRGVKTSEKMILMFLRVFSHIFYFVIPNILEVIREEGVLTRKRYLTGSRQHNRLPLSQRIGKMVQMLVNIGVDSICSAIRYVPLWAEEISKLPGDAGANQNSDTAKHSEN